jgi:hypothetical protein
MSSAKGRQFEYLAITNKLLIKKILKRTGSRTDPCPTPDNTSYAEESAPQ